MNGSGEESQKGFRMNNLPPAFGRELDYSTSLQGFHVIAFAIFPCEDLFIKSDMEFEITFPPNFQHSPSGVILKAKQPEILGDSIYLTKPGNQISFPWLEDAIQYPISVWFYAVRQLLKRSKRTSWRTPVLIKSSFEENMEMMLSGRSIELSYDPLPLEGTISNSIRSICRTYILASVYHMSHSSSIHCFVCAFKYFIRC